PRDPAPADEESAATPRTAWEFYLGGMAGLTLGFVLWALGQTGENAADAILFGGLMAALRSGIWFAAFAVLERVPWIGAGRGLALVVGVAALLVNLTVSGGIALPSVALPLWVVAALALNTLARPAGERPPRSWVGAVVPVPLLIAACLVYH